MLHDRVQVQRVPIAPGMLPGHNIEMSGLCLICKTNWAREALAQEIGRGSMLLRVLVLSLDAPNANNGVVRTNLAKPSGEEGEKYQVTMLHGAYGEPRESQFRVLDTFVGR